MIRNMIRETLTKKDDVGIKSRLASDMWSVAIKWKQIVPIKCREKWKNSVYLKLNAPCRVIISPRPITLHIRLYVHIDWIFRFQLVAYCILNLRAMGN